MCGSGKEELGVFAPNRYLVTFGTFQFICSDMAFIVALAKKKYGELKNLRVKYPLAELYFEGVIVTIVRMSE